MWSRPLLIVCCLALTISSSQSHSIEKRGLIAKLFGDHGKSTKDVEENTTPSERSKIRELMKNPIFVSMLTAAVGMLVQKATASKDLSEVCDSKVVKMARMAANFHPDLLQAVNLLGCNNAQRKSKDGDEETERTTTDQGVSESSDQSEKKSTFRRLFGRFTGDKMDLFGSDHQVKSLKAGDTLPSSKYKLDQDDAETVKSFKNLLGK